MTKYNPSTPPPRVTLPIIQRLIIVYKIWHGYLIRFNKLTKYSIGSKIDSLFLEIMTNLFIASRKSRDQKLIYINIASDKLDILKFLLQITWEIRTLDEKKYIELSEPLYEIGKMLGGWQKQTKIP